MVFKKLVLEVNERMYCSAAKVLDDCPLVKFAAGILVLQGASLD